MLTSMIKDNIDILMVLEKDLDSSFKNAQFAFEGYAPPFRYDKNCHGGGILLFIRDDIPAKILSTASKNNFEGFFVRVTFSEENIPFVLLL